MNCRYHKENEAKFICDKCKMPICEDCASDIRGNKICKSCIEKSIYSERNRGERIGFFARIWFFMMACLPGAAHMQMGLFRKGLQLMISFIGAIVLFSFVNVDILIPLFIIPIWFFSFFDAYNTRKKLRKDEVVEDVEFYNYDFILDYVKGNKRALGIALVVFGVLGFMNTFETYFHQYDIVLFNLNINLVFWAIRRAMIPVALIVSGLYLLSKIKKSQKEMQQENQMYEE